MAPSSDRLPFPDTSRSESVSENPAAAEMKGRRLKMRRDVWTRTLFFWVLAGGVHVGKASHVLFRGSSGSAWSGLDWERLWLLLSARADCALGTKVNLWSAQRAGSIPAYVDCNMLGMEGRGDGGGSGMDDESGRASWLYLVIASIVRALQSRRCARAQWRASAAQRHRVAPCRTAGSSVLSSPLIRGGTEGARAPSPFGRRAAAADTHFKSLAAPKP